jgi:hypothetical protein
VFVDFGAVREGTSPGTGSQLAVDWVAMASRPQGERARHLPQSRRSAARALPWRTLPSCMRSVEFDGGDSSSVGEPVPDAESDSNSGSDSGAVGGKPNANANGEGVPIRSSGTEPEAAVLLSPTAATVCDVGGLKVSLHPSRWEF